MNTARYTLMLAALVSCVLFASTGYAQSDEDPTTAQPESFQAALEDANAAYNNGNYKRAVEGYIEAIQAGPREARAYRNLARSYFWLSKYAAAMTYYDFYIQLAPDAKDIEQIQSERRLASSRAGDEIYTLTESQKMARRALMEQLEGGRAYTSGGGGAWGLYNSLLRTDYARPNLADFQRRLVRSLLEEFDGMLVPTSGQPVPQLDLDQWQLQSQRLEAARLLTRDEAMRGIIERRSAVAEAGIAFLTGNREGAVALIQMALEKNPDLSFLRWHHVVALMEAGQNEQALEAVGELDESLAATNASDSHVDYATVLRANILRQLERHDDAAGLYLDVLD